MFRIRFAPSPTGYVHLGSLRTMIYNYLLAKKNNGVNIIRVEDTDQTRLIEDAIESIYDAVDWMKIPFDEGPREGGDYGPYIQSERKDRHLEIANELIDRGVAYKCFCTKEELDEMREMQQKLGKPTGYDRRHRNLSEDEIRKFEEEGRTYVVRQKIPLDEKVVFEDLVRGKIEVDTNTLQDHILLKSDGFPTYQLANIVDDHDMEITHVTRGEEWLPSTPYHILLYRSLEWKEPLFAHFPNILNKEGKKLSKRHGDVFFDQYRDNGFLRESMISYLVMLGWNPGTDQEIFTIEELIEQFDLSRIQKSGAVFDIEKFKWVNGKFIMNLDNKDLAKRIKPFLEKQEFYKEISDDEIENIVEQLKPRMKTLKEGAENTRWYFELPEFEKDLFLHEKMKVEEEIAKYALEWCHESLNSVENWNLETIKDNLSKLIEQKGLKNGQLLWPLRVALTGLPFSPGAYEVATLLGKNECLDRIKKGIEKL